MVPQQVHMCYFQLQKLCECLFLDNSVLHGTDIEENQRDYCVHDICSKRGTRSV
jgi:hypothetical protein